MQKNYIVYEGKGALEMKKKIKQRKERKKMEEKEERDEIVI